MAALENRCPRVKLAPSASKWTCSGDKTNDNMPKILLIDDDADERKLTRRTLSDDSSAFEIIDIATRAHYRNALEQGDFNLVVTEYRLAWTDGFCVFADFKNLYPTLPVIMLTGHGDETVAVRAIKQGMADYIGKNRRDTLFAAVRQALQRPLESPPCQNKASGILWCEKWDQVISKLTSDFAYSLGIGEDGRPTFEWVTEPFKRFLDSHARYGEAPGLLDHHFGLTVHADDQALADRHVAALLNGYEDIAEYRIVSNGGEVRCFSDHALPIRDWSSGKVVRIYGTIQDITWRRNAEDKLRLMQRAIDSSNNGIVITDLADTDYAIIYVNQAFSTLTCYNSEELIGQNCRILQGDDRDQPEIDNLRQALRQQKDGYAILRNYRKDGTPFWNEIYISPVTDGHNRVTHFIGVQNDVTARIEMEQALQQSDLKMSAIFEHVSDAVLIFDQQGIVIRVNPSAEKIFGYGAGEMTGVRLERFLADAERKTHGQYLSNLSNDDEELVIDIREVTALKKDGGPFLVAVGIHELRLENNHLFVATIHDLTERKRAEAKLKASEERYRALFENSAEAILVNRGGERIEQVNQACLRLWRADTPEQLLAKKPLELVHPDFRDLVNARIERNLERDASVPSTFEEKILRLDGTAADVLVSTIPVVDQQGPLIFVLLVDITERKAAEMALRDSHKRIQDLSGHLEMVRENERIRIARELHDDLGAFLTALKMELSWLERHLPDELRECHIKIRSMIGEVNDSIQTVKRIITDLRPSLLDHLGLLPAIEWLVENFSQRSGIPCSLELPDSKPAMDTNRSTAIFRITQEALTNVLNHAHASKVEIAIEADANRLILTIADNGRGMTADRQRQDESYGIQGMRERANYFGAEFTVDGQAGAGTRIILKMPLKDNESERTDD